MSNDEGMTIFEKIIRREIPAEIVFEDDDVLAFRDVNPQAPVHVLIVPKRMLARLADATERGRPREENGRRRPEAAATGDKKR